MKLDRSDKEDAREVFEFLLPDKKIRWQCLEFLADSIQTANRLAADRWGITLYTNSILMNCGRIEVLIIQPDLMHVIIDSESLPELPPEAGVEIRVTRADFETAGKELLPGTVSEIPAVAGKGFYLSVPDSIACDFPTNQAELVLPQIRESHTKLLQKAANTPLFLNRKKAHSPGVIESLKESLKITLPQPAYFHGVSISTTEQIFSDTPVEEMLPDIDQIIASALEGGKQLVTHLRRERNPKIVEAKKKQVLNETGRLKCEVCGFDFREKYGELGEGFCEAHHQTPLAEAVIESETTLDDLAILCSNCHRMIHRTEPMLSITGFRELLAQLN